MLSREDPLTGLSLERAVALPNPNYQVPQRLQPLALPQITGSASAEGIRLPKPPPLVGIDVPCLGVIGRTVFNRTVIILTDLRSVAPR